MRRIISGLLTGAMALSMVAGFSANAEAALAIRITQGATVVNATDLDADGLVAFAGAIGLTGWTVSTTGFGYPLLTNDLSDPAMDLLSLQVNGVTGGTIVIEVSQTDWTGGPEPLFSFNIGGTSTVAGTFTYDLLWDPNNQLFGGAVFATGGGNLLPSPFGGAFTGGPAGDAQYSLTQRVTITHNAGGFSSFDADLNVPEPASMALFGLGMLGFGIASRRRRTV